MFLKESLFPWPASMGAMSHNVPESSIRTHHDDGFNPYDDNGGTAVAIAGQDFCVIGTDTRQSLRYSINTRFAPKSFFITNKIVLASTGMHADLNTLELRIRSHLEWYKYQHEKEPSISAVAQLLQVLLYQKRFFPFYTFNILGGLDSEGKGAVYSFDPVGSYEREPFRAGGSGASMIQPFLDSQIGLKNRALSTSATTLTLELAIQVIKDAFTSAAERDIYTGDYLQLMIITRDEGKREELYELRKD